jgi:peptidoglycan-N-acetylglucosamine deacetylase
MRRPLIAGLLVLLASSPVSAARTPGLVYTGPRDRPLLALTFDADMTRSMREAVLEGRAVHYDARIIALLRRTNTPATLFLTGFWAKTYPARAREFAADPLFELANHSHTHPGFRSPCYGLPTISTDHERRREVRRARRLIGDMTGVTTRFFRFPGGCHAETDVALVRELNHIPVQWNVASGDPRQTSPQVIIDNVLKRARNGAIVVMHLNGAPNAPATYDALKTIIPKLRARGFRLVTLGTLLGSASTTADEAPPQNDEAWAPALPSEQAPTRGRNHGHAGRAVRPS